MLYGLYLSATGVITNSYRQDVISNNLANAETNGFKRDLTMFRQRRTAAQEMPGKLSWTDPRMEAIGGGTLAEPTTVDTSTGGFEETGNTLDTAIQGRGYFTVDDHGQQKLTRNGSFLLDRAGTLTMAGGGNQPVLDTKGNAIRLNASLRGETTVATDGTIAQAGKAVARINMVDVPDPAKLHNEAGTLLAYPDMDDLKPAAGQLRSEVVERSNVDPATELTALMETQRELEANANMIHYQDQTLDKLVNSVGKIS